MMMSCRSVGSVFAAVGAALVAAPLAAQTPTADQPADTAGRTSAAIFEGVRQPAEDVLVLSTSLFSAYDNETSPHEQMRQSTADGAFSGLGFGLTFTPNRNRRIQFTGRGSGSYRYYPALSTLLAATQDASAALLFQMSQDFDFGVRGGFGYVPYFDFAAQGNGDASDDSTVRLRETAFSDRRMRTVDAGVDLTYSPSARTSLAIAYSNLQTEVLDESHSANDNTVSVRYGRGVTRRSTMRAGYTHRESEFDVSGAGASNRIDDLEVGLDREWARSATRRTVVSFTVGPSRIEQGSNALLRAFGGVAISHAFLRSWSIRGSYRRGVAFVDALPEPVLSDSLSTTVTGLLTPALDLSLSGGAVLGDVGIESTGTTFDTYFGSARLQYAIGRAVAIYGEYMYHSQEYRGGTFASVPESRNGIRVGLTWYAPLIQARPRATPSGRGERSQR